VIASFPRYPSQRVAAPSSKAELRLQASVELAASIRRGAALGKLAAGQLPWQILLTCFLQETSSETDKEEFEFMTVARNLQFDDRWFFAVQDAGLIQIKTNHCYVITDLGVQVVEKCLGD
jgi:hypothetical protein